MSQYAHTRQVLSSSTDGRPILIATTTGSGDAVHTVSATSGVIEEVWLWASNTSASTITVDVYWGGTTDPDDKLRYRIDAGVTSTIVPGISLQNGLTVKVRASVTNVCTVAGHSNILTPK